MAYDKVIDSAALDSDLIAVANAIRAKGGTSGALAFPSGFIDAISAIIAGGGNDEGETTGLVYDMGDFVVEVDHVSGTTTTANGTSDYMRIPHNLGVVPDFILVWTDHWAGMTAETPISYEDGKYTAIGYGWFRNIAGISNFRASTTATSLNPAVFGFQIVNNDYRLSIYTPTSASYGLANENQLPDAETIGTPTSGVNGPRYRADAVYHYFVSRAWWNTHDEEANSL